jgi:hypothetical protein
MHDGKDDLENMDHGYPSGTDSRTDNNRYTGKLHHGVTTLQERRTEQDG